MKKCFKCGVIKGRGEFYKHPQMGDGLLGKCKGCTKKDSNERRLLKLQDPIWANKERKRQREKEERRRNAGLVKKYKKAKATQPKANIALTKAVRDGVIKREPCAVCGKVKAEAHHEDYSKHLDVAWLCSRHHADRHIYLRDQAALGVEPVKIKKFIGAAKRKFLSDVAEGDKIEANFMTQR